MAGAKRTEGLRLLGGGGAGWGLDTSSDMDSNCGLSLAWGLPLPCPLSGVDSYCPSLSTLGRKEALTCVPRREWSAKPLKDLLGAGPRAAENSRFDPRFDPSRALEQVSHPLQASVSSQEGRDDGARSPSLCSARARGRQACSTTERPDTQYAVCDARASSEGSAASMEAEGGFQEGFLKEGTPELSPEQ